MGEEEFYEATIQRSRKFQPRMGRKGWMKGILGYIVCRKYHCGSNNHYNEDVAKVSNRMKARHPGGIISHNYKEFISEMTEENEQDEIEA